MTQEEIFSKFLSISDYESSLYQDKLEDISLGDFIIARHLPDGIKIYYLHNGNSIFIPKDWIKLFTSFNIHSGSQSKYTGISSDDTNLNKFIYYFLMLIINLIRKNGDTFLKILYKLFSIGSKEFRIFFKEKTSKDLEDIEFCGIDNELTI